MPKLNKAALTKAFADDWRDYFRSLKAKYPDERWYGFFAIGHDDMFGMTPVAMGENDLRRRCEERAAKKRESVEKLMESERFDICASVYLSEGELSKRVEEVLDPLGDRYELSEREYENFMQAYLESAISALKVLDKEGLFGVGVERTKIVVSIAGTDQSDLSRRDCARLTNPPAALVEFERQLQIDEPVGTYRTLGKTPIYQVNDMRVSSDGSVIAMCGSNEIELWTLNDGKSRVRSSAKGNHWRLALSGDGSLLVVSDGNLVRLWRRAPASAKRWSEGPVMFEAPEQVNGLAFSPDGLRLLVMDSSGALHCLNAASATVVWRADIAYQRDFEISPDGELIVGISGEDSLVLDAKNGREIRRLEANVACVAFSPDSQTMVIGTEGTLVANERQHNASVLIYSVNRARLERQFSMRAKDVRAIAVSNNGTRVAVSVAGGWIRVMNLVSGEIVESVRGRQESVDSLSFLPGDKELVGAGRDVYEGPPVYIWKLP